MDTDRIDDDPRGNDMPREQDAEPRHGDGASAGDASEYAARTNGRSATTSALTRDAARLRSVMVQAGDRSDAVTVMGDRGEAGTATTMQFRGDLARAAGMPSLPGLDPAGVPAGVERHQGIGINTVPDELPVPAGTRRATSLRTPAADGKPARSVRTQLPSLQSAADEAEGATKLKSIEGLTRQRGVEPAQMAAAALAADAIRTDRLTVDEHPMPVYTEIERKENYSYGTDEKTPHEQPSTGAHDERKQEPYAAEPVRIAAAAAPIYSERRMSRQRSGPRSPVTIAMVLVGLAIGIGLYAGGGDLLSGIFSNKKEGVSVVSPSTVTERPPMPPSQASIGGASAGMASVAPQAPADTFEAVPPRMEHSEPAPAHAEPQAISSRPVVTSPAVEREPVVVDDEERQAAPRGNAGRHDTLTPTRSAVTPKAPAKPVADAAAKAKADDKKAADKAKTPVTAAADKGGAKETAGKYVVQVRATPDEAEAKLIAKKLRGKGAKDVSIVPTKAKNGSTFYKVRYNATGTGADAQQAASRAGYKDVWVLKQK